jgi:hypothetical protein
MSGLLKRIFGGGENDMAAQAQEAMASATEMTGAAQGLTDQAKDLMEGGVPDVAELKKAIDGLSPEQLQSVTQKALDTLPPDTRSQLGQAIQGFASKTGGQVSPGVASGNTADLSTAISGALKGEGGLSSLAGMLGGGGNGAAGNGGASDMVSGAMGSLTGSGGGTGGLDLGALLQSPLAKTVLAALIPAIMKAASGK